MGSIEELPEDPVHELYSQLQAELGPKARKSLERIRSACNTISLVHGVITYSRVSQVALERFGGPAYQTILNNKLLKSYIDARALAASQNFGRANRPNRPTASALTKRIEPYPCEGLDPKTKACIDMLRSEVARNERLIETLQNALGKQTKRAPLSFEKALQLGPGQAAELLLPSPRPDELLPAAMRRALTSVLAGEITNLQIETRDGKQRLAGTRHGTLEILLSPFQWSEALEWLRRTDSAMSSRS